MKRGLDCKVIKSNKADIANRNHVTFVTDL